MKGESERDGGFWRLRHDDLAAVLARHDLTGEQLRVFLALADLTLGYGKARDVVSLSQIAERAGMYAMQPDGARRPDCSHVARALKRLKERGLYCSAPGILPDDHPRRTRRHRGGWTGQQTLSLSSVALLSRRRARRVRCDLEAANEVLRPMPFAEAGRGDADQDQAFAPAAGQGTADVTL